MGLCMKSLLLLLTIVLVIEGRKAEFQLRPRVTAEIGNELSKNQDLMLHFKSKEDSSGEHTINNWFCKRGEVNFKPCPKVTVQIVNELTNNQDLTFHCKSKDDDLGEHTIKNGGIYEFKFRPRFIFGATLFFCSFNWPSDNTTHYFDIYDEDRDWCDACYWDIAESGPCLQNDGLGRRLCYSWNPKP